MRKLLSILLLTGLMLCCLYSCVNNQNNSTTNNNENEDVVIENGVITNDTVLFKYVLNTDKKKVDIKTKSLLKEKVLDKKKEYHFIIDILGEKVNYIDEGYKCKLYINGNEYDAIMNLEFYKDSLLKQEFFLYDDITFEIEKLYGNPNSIPSNYNVGIEHSEVTFWQQGNKAIYTLRIGSLKYLTFESMSLMREKNKDEMQQAIETSNSNKEKSKNMGW